MECGASLASLVGRTPVVRLERVSSELRCDVFGKLEGFNPGGSIKDRPAAYVLSRAFQEGHIGRGSLVVESSSGNFGVALATFCRMQGLQFVCVVDPKVSGMNRYLMEQLGARVEIVLEPDSVGGYLESRLNRVREICDRNHNAYWTNQYANEWNWQAHYHGTASELLHHFTLLGQRIDYLFAPVSSGGTIMGCAKRLKEHDPSTEIVAVDIEGSVIFGGPPGLRHVPGPGSSRVPELLDRRWIDHVVRVTEYEMIQECRGLLLGEQLFVGGSSGAVLRGVRRYFSRRPSELRCRPTVVVIFPDRGERYYDTIYDDRWVAKRYHTAPARATEAGNAEPVALEAL